MWNKLQGWNVARSVHRGDGIQQFVPKKEKYKEVKWKNWRALSEARWNVLKTKKEVRLPPLNSADYHKPVDGESTGALKKETFVRRQSNL